MGERPTGAKAEAEARMESSMMAQGISLDITIECGSQLNTDVLWGANRHRSSMTLPTLTVPVSQHKGP
jgi:hypothetical protein